jgi:hypothetical protein
MIDDSKPSSAAAKGIPSLLETAVELRFLLLLLCFALYLDIWLIENNVNPLTISLQEAYKGLLSTSVFSFLLFIGSYSLLMAGFFPVLRRLIGISRTLIQSSVRLFIGSEEQSKLSDWSIAFVCLSSYNCLMGLFMASEDVYRGLAIHILSSLAGSGIAGVVFLLSIMALWFYCLSIATNVDESTV